jgi:hypothetical protein
MSKKITKITITGTSAPLSSMLLITARHTCCASRATPASSLQRPNALHSVIGNDRLGRMMTGGLGRKITIQLCAISHMVDPLLREGCSSARTEQI